MLKNSLLSLLFILSLAANAQSDSIPEEPLAIVEVMPEFPGGPEELMRFIKKNLEYPPSDKERGIQGTVFIMFVVEKDGKISNPTILRGIPCGAASDAEAIRLINSMPPWKPASQNGRAVRIQFNLPIKFSLNKTTNFDCSAYQRREKQITEHYNKGVDYTDNNENEKAIIEFTEVIKLNPEDIDALYNRGILYFKTEKKDAACKDWYTIKVLGKADADELINKYCK